MQQLARLAPLLTLTFTLAACEGGTADATPADAPADPPQMQMIEADDDAPIEAGDEDDASIAKTDLGSTGLYVATSTENVEDVDIRHSSLVPHGTPAENADAFTSMRKTKRDSFPVGGIGPQGIHVDSLVVGRGFSKSRCEEETNTFQIEEDDRANLCIRVVHGGAIDEQLTVKWTRDGRGPKVTKLNLRNGHAYRTRAYLPLRHYSAGNWNVTVSASDGTLLGEADFVVSK